MTNAKIDSNSKATITALLNTNGKTIVPIQADPTNHGIGWSDNTTGSDMGGTIAATDENDRPTIFVSSSANDGTTVALYADASGNLLVNSN